MLLSVVKPTTEEQHLKSRKNPKDSTEKLWTNRHQQSDVTKVEKCQSFPVMRLNHNRLRISVIAWSYRVCHAYQIITHQMIYHRPWCF